MEWLVEIYFLVVVSGVILYGSMGNGDSFGDNRDVDGSVIWLTSISFMVGGILSINSSIDGGWLGGLVYIFSGLCVGSSKERIEGGREYGSIILIVGLGMGLLISAKDMMSVYLALEMQGLGLYVLASYERRSSFATEGGMKYFIMGAFGSGLLLFGSSLLYGVMGTVEIEDIGRLAEIIEGIDRGVVKVGFWFVSVGLLFKLSAAPFHMWVPDVYEGGGVSVVKYFAVVPKIAVLGVIIRLYSVMPEDYWREGLILISMVSMIISVIGALYQRRVKRFLAYSGIGHVGYMLMGICSGVTDSVNGVLIYLIVYVIMTFSMWEIIEKSGVVYIDEIGRLGKENRVLGVVVCMLMFSIAGVPPMAGFFAKLNVFLSAMEGGLYVLGLVGVISSVVSTFYYLRWVKIIYFEKQKSMEYSAYRKYGSRVISVEYWDVGVSILQGIVIWFILMYWWVNPLQVLGSVFSTV